MYALILWPVKYKSFLSESFLKCARLMLISRKKIRVLCYLSCSLCSDWICIWSQSSQSVWLRTVLPVFDFWYHQSVKRLSIDEIKYCDTNLNVLIAWVAENTIQLCYNSISPPLVTLWKKLEVHSFPEIIFLLMLWSSINISTFLF